MNNEYASSSSPPEPPPKDDPWKGEKTQVETTEEENIGSIPTEKPHRPLKHYICCICCPCLPMWARYGCCTLLILFIIFLIIIGILAALFKVPTVDFNGPTQHPDGLQQFERNNSSLSFSINFGLKIGVVNPNIESITFESIRAIAYYPTAPTRSVGGGVINNVHINSNGITNFTFPFSINYDATKDEGYQMLTDIAEKCGLLGGAMKQDLDVQYDLIPTVRVAGIAISPTIHESSHFPCPINEGQLTAVLATKVMDIKNKITSSSSKSKLKTKNTSENEPDENEPDENEPDENEKDES